MLIYMIIRGGKTRQLWLVNKGAGTRGKTNELQALLINNHAQGKGRDQTSRVELDIIIDTLVTTVFGPKFLLL